MTPVLAGVLVYLVLQVWLGFYLSARIATEDDYLVAGRKLGGTLTAFTVFATWFGAETCVGAAGQAYEGGLLASSAEPFGYAGCLLLLGAVFSRRLWALRLTTLGDLFRLRYGPRVERLAVLLMVPTSLLWAAAQVRAFGSILSSVGRIEPAAATLLAAAVVIVYTAAGGLLADVVSDFIQGLVLTVGLLALLVVFAFGPAGDTLRSVPLAAVASISTDRSWLDVLEMWAVPVIGSVMAQELVARVSAARSVRVAQWGTLAGAAMYLAVGIIPVVLGLAARSAGIEVADSEQLLLAIGARYLPTVLHVVFAGALVSAILSTVDSTLLVSGSLIAHNVILPARPQADARARVAINRVAVVGCGLVAYAIAVRGHSVHGLVEEASSFGSAGLFVAGVAALYGLPGGERAGLAALVTGLVAYMAASWWLPLDQPFLASLAAASIAYALAAIPVGRAAVAGA